MGRKSKNSSLSSVLRVMVVFTVAVVFLLAAFFIILRFSIKGRTVEVPNIVGKSFLEATQILNKSHLGTPIIEGEKYNAGMPEGYVVEQKPKPGNRVKTGREIKVFISKGTEAGVVPNVVGETVDDAQPSLQALGLEVGTITRVHSDDFPQEGVIIAHTPPPQAKVQKGTRVNLLVSMGRTVIQYTMPDLAGMWLNEAIELIKMRGLRPGLVEREVSPDVNTPDVVLDQSPQPGNRIKRGAVVNLVVSSVGGG
jgi:serine/threonine-protein kinase